MEKVNVTRPSMQAKVELVRRTRGRNYSASLRLEGFKVSATRKYESASISYKEEVIAKYKQLAN